MPLVGEEVEVAGHWRLELDLEARQSHNCGRRWVDW